MTRLAPILFDRRYADLVELGQAGLPSTAPGWTDYNAHDPGITLIELLAWTAEAEIYSLSKTRRDERAAYAKLMGVAPHGTRPAQGLIWADHDDPTGPEARIFRGRIIDPKTAIHLERAETPNFRAAYPQLWVPARLTGLTSRLANGTSTDHLEANRRGGPAFQPFGTDEGRDAVLRMTFEATGNDPLFESGRTGRPLLMIGVRSESAVEAGMTQGQQRSPLAVELVAGGDRVALPVIHDTTGGLLRTGYLALDVAAVDFEPREVVLELRAPRGFARAPRLLRIDVNVIPIIQQADVDQPEGCDGSPDFSFDLRTPGLEFEANAEPVTITVQAADSLQSWPRVDDLAECGPDDRVFAFDAKASNVIFGNGLNGARPPQDSTIVAHYSVTEGPNGNIAANRKWVVGGFDLYGLNFDPTAGGQEPSGVADQRREARRLLREEHAMVTGGDFEQAALALPGLEVGRAAMLSPSNGDLATGTLRLIAMRKRPTIKTAAAVPETRQWLESVRHSLAARVPLGSRLSVIAPDYVRFTIALAAESEPTMDPASVGHNIVIEIARRLTLIRDNPGTDERGFGIPVTSRDIAAWIQALPEVRTVSNVVIRVSGQGVRDQVKLPRHGLPVFDADKSDIRVQRGDSGSAT
jgi:predicted phage baseplate assembly protein